MVNVCLRQLVHMMIRIPDAAARSATFLSSEISSSPATKIPHATHTTNVIAAYCRSHVE